jgi:predicted PurR-regulated permease PerM
MNPRDKKSATETVLGLCTIVLVALVVAALYFGRPILVPIALAVLFTFMLSPLAGRLERHISRGAAVCGLAIIMFLCCAATAWMIGRQSLDLMARLPDYRANIEKKIQAAELPQDNPIERFSQMVADVKSEIPGITPSQKAAAEKQKARSAPTPQPVPAPARPSPSAGPLDQLEWLLTPFLRTVGFMGVVMILVIFMLLKREDLQGRFIKIVGHGRISTTTRAMEEAAARVSRYLLAQLLVNVTFGTAMALGLFVIGVPNAFLWGATAAVLRFIPYIGTPIAAVGPIVLAMAVSPGWQMVGLTVSLFLVLELITANLLEPLLFRSSTGISSLALIITAIFWAWLWGPVGLLLSTPLTVCVAVIGKHVRRLSFLSILLGTEEPLTPSEECYHRLLVGGIDEVTVVVDARLRETSLPEVYDSVLLPALSMAEVDFGREELDEEQRSRVLQGVREIIDDLSSRTPPSAKEAGEDAAPRKASLLPSNGDCRVVCIPLRSERDHIAGSSLLHLLHEEGIIGHAAELGMPMAELEAYVAEKAPDAVCISALPPSNIIHARRICAALRERFPKMKIIVGIWGATGKLDEPIKLLRANGADEVVVSLAQAVAQLVIISSSIIGDMVPAGVPPDEEDRLKAVTALKAYTEDSDPAFGQMTRNLSRTFDVPIALITLIDRDRQLFKSRYGVPPDLADVREIPRSVSICSHVVAENSVLVVEDLARDRRFANNPLIRQNHLRFYAGAPIHAANGQPVGALCILDTKPRKFGASEIRMLKIMAEEISEQLSIDVKQVSESVAPF